MRRQRLSAIMKMPAMTSSGRTDILLQIHAADHAGDCESIVLIICAGKPIRVKCAAAVVLSKIF